MAEYEQVHATWDRLSQDAYVGMSNAVKIVAAAANTDAGRRALEEILSDDDKVAIIESDALSYLRISRDVPLPPGVEDHRIDAYFRENLYTGTRITKTHRVKNPKEFLYFNMAIGMVTGTLDDVAAARQQMEGSGYDPVIARMPDRTEKAIGSVMVNEFRDTTFGPYNEVIFIVTAVPEDAPESAKTVDYVNGFSLQTPLDRGATLYLLKLWLNKLRPIDGGNDFLGTNKELGSFIFEDKKNGTREFRVADKDGKWLVRGTMPRTLTPAGAEAARAAYHEAAQRAGTKLPTGTVAAVPVASRPDEDFGKPASKWAFTIDWRRPVAQEVMPSQLNLSFGDGEWGRRFESLGFTPALTTYGPSCIGKIHQHIGDCPYVAETRFHD